MKQFENHPYTNIAKLVDMNLAKFYHIRDLLESQKYDVNVYHTFGKLDLMDFTFVIPVRIDCQERLDNLNICIDSLNKICDTNVIVIESDKERKILDLPSNCFYGFHQTDSDLFLKPKLFNKGYKMSNTKFCVGYDCDTILSPICLIQSVMALRSNEYKFSLPFKIHFSMNEKTKMNFRDNLLLPLVQEEFDNEKIHSVNPFWKPPKFDNGLCFMFEYDAFKRCGLENENLIYHGFDDWERYCRVRKLGYDIHNSHGLCYHLYHPQKNDGWYGKDNLNFEEFARVLDLSNYQLKLEVEQWEWACDRTSPF